MIECRFKKKNLNIRCTELCFYILYIYDVQYEYNTIFETILSKGNFKKKYFHYNLYQHITVAQSITVDIQCLTVFVIV